MYKELKEINSRPSPFEFYTAKELWTDKHTASQMLKFHLDDSTDLASRNKDFIRRSAAWIISHFKINQTMEIADFGCGPGLYTSKLAETGVAATGIDFSCNSIRYAESIAAQKGLKIDYIVADYLEVELSHQFDLIILIFCDFCALSPGQRKLLLKKFRALLRPGGSLLLDVHSLNIFNEKNEYAVYDRNQLNGFWSDRDYYGFLNTYKYEKEKVSLDKYTIIEESGTRVIYNWLQYFSPDSLREEFESSGFRIEEIFSDVAGKSFASESPDFAVVAGIM